MVKARLHTLREVAAELYARIGPTNTLSPSTPAMHSGRGVRWATAKSSTCSFGAHAHVLPDANVNECS